jgi:DNA mismatch repair protein PMS2
VGAKLEYDPNGRLLSQNSVSRGGVGTTVALKGLFTPLPVRHREFSKNLKKEFAKAVGILYGIGIISKGVRYKRK